MSDDLDAEIATHHPVTLPTGEVCIRCKFDWPCLVQRLTDERDKILKAGTAMAEALGVLLSGDVEMQPAPDGPMTFETMVMLLQMLGVHRGQWRALTVSSEMKPHSPDD